MGGRGEAGFNAMKDYLCSLPEEPMTFDIPSELSNENPEDIYQISLLNMPKYIQQYVRKAYGYTEEEDGDSSCGKVVKWSFDTATGIHKLLYLYPTSKFAEKKSSIYMAIQKEAEDVVTNELYKEDLVHGRYHLYKYGTISGIKDATNVRAKIPGAGGSVNIKALALTFPMDACDVYLSMKFTGEVYGGDAKDENAIYFDRMIFVRK